MSRIQAERDTLHRVQTPLTALGNSSRAVPARSPRNDDVGGSPIQKKIEIQSCESLNPSYYPVSVSKFQTAYSCSTYGLS
ncbi:hypothetical protein VNO78_28954 [Psophocarpus tetragonolobus]|uniref:Uncharacterized protein n=1 Tax=Psophocarpus tetragonolobus TaxID=3891 RepID=A0AAN9WZU0_PSOTE